MTAAGIDTSKFKPHSTRSAATSAAKVQYGAKVMQTIIDEYHEYRNISTIFNEILP